jgi:hypothetical protein
MITSSKTRRLKPFEFIIKNGVVSHNDEFSDHFPIVTTIDVV